MRTEEEIAEMKAAKKQEEPERVKSYEEGLRNGWLHALDWMVKD